MTIKTRNLSTLILFFISIAIFLANVILLVYTISSGIFTFPENTQQKIFFQFTSNKYTFISAVISIFIFMLYVSTITICFVILFEKTHSTEIIFFSMFLIACLFESFRILIPFMNLWNSFSLIATISGRAVIFGRMLAPISLLASVVASSSEQRQNVERNIAILVILSLISTWFLPLDSTHPSVTCIFPCGSIVFSSVRVLIIATVATSQILNTISFGMGMQYAVSLIVLSVGYLVLCITFSIFTLVFGTLLLSSGSALYLKNLHAQYLWR